MDPRPARKKMAGQSILFVWANEHNVFHGNSQRANSPWDSLTEGATEMEGILAAVLGLGFVAVSPFVPGLRPYAKKLVIGSLAAASAAATAAAVTGEHWKDLVAEARAERDAAEQAKAIAAEPETTTIHKP